MGLNMKAVRAAKDNLNKGGGKEYLQQKSLTENGTAIRIAELGPELVNGLPYIEVQRVWINKKPYVSPATFGEPCPMKREIEKARQSGDEEVLDLINDPEVYKEQTEYMFTVLELKELMNNRDELVGVEVIDDTWKFLSAGTMLTQKIMDVISQRQNIIRGSEQGMMDREKGKNMLLSRTGQKLTTKYSAEATDVYDFSDAKYDHLYNNIPNMYEKLKGEIKSSKYLRAVVKKFLYGDEIPEELEAEEKARFEAVRAATKKSTGNAPKVEEEEDAPVKTRKVKTPVIEEDDEEEEEKPVKKVKRAAPVEDEEEDEDPVDAALAKGAAKKKAEAAKKPTRNVVKDHIATQDDDDLDFDAEFDD